MIQTRIRFSLHIEFLQAISVPIPEKETKVPNPRDLNKSLRETYP